jgi:hypothetical protein
VRRETGKEQEVQVLYGEDLASHTAPEPCAVFREEQGEASAGARAGWPWSRERVVFRVPTALPVWKATRATASTQATVRLGVVRDPSMHARALPGNREILWLAAARAHRRSAWGRPDGRSPR